MYTIILHIFILTFLHMCMYRKIFSWFIPVVRNYKYKNYITYTSQTQRNDGIIRVKGRNMLSFT